MTTPRIAAIGVALALAGTATTASAYITTYRDVYVTPAPVVRVAPEVIAYDEGYVTYYPTSTPTVVERYVPARETVIVQADPVIVTAPRYETRYETAYWDSRNPQWGHLIDYGLFNRRGENDFGR